MGFAAVARVTGGTWTACAVRDTVSFGLKPGGQLPLETTLCTEVRQSRTPIVIDQASTDPRYCGHHTPRTYKIESYISVPIVLSNGDYFGNLCAIDARPAKVSEPRIVSMFTLFAQLVALHLENERRRESAEAALLDERAVGELREQFIAILGHDLRNPLSAVSACGQLLEKKSTDPALATIATRLMTNVRRMSALIDDTLDFARARLGSGIGVQIAEVDDLERALLAVASELQDSNPGRSIDCSVSIGRTIRCDRGRIQQLASNLLSNALRHGSSSHPVYFFAHIDDTDLVIQVANRGTPIPPESLARIFEPFWRHSMSASREGLGLGLHICAQIVRAYAGRLDVESTAASGTRFTARIPLLRTHASG